MDDAIRGFQKANGLKTDGWMKPGGETEKMMHKVAAKSSNKKQSEDKGVFTHKKNCKTVHKAVQKLETEMNVLAMQRDSVIDEAKSC